MSKIMSQKQSDYFELSPLMLFPGTCGKFNIYLKQEGEFVLYASAGESFSLKHRRTLHESGVKEVYIHTYDRERYNFYVENNLGMMLQDESLPMNERAAILYSASTDLVKGIFDNFLPENFQQEQFDRVVHMIRDSIKFLTLENALKTLASFISHDYHTYSHCVQAFVYTVSILATYGDYDENILVDCGMGAILHDVGKCNIPKSILKKTGKLNSEERRQVNTHPLLGVSMLTHINLPCETLNSILFHHERMDGRGYPGGLRGKNIPIYVRALTISDIYDALTSDRPYAKGIRPFEALRIMRDEMGSGLDMDVFKRFISVLSGAEII